MRPKVKELVEVAKRAWGATAPLRQDAKAALDKTAPARQLADKIGDAGSKFDIILRQAESGANLQATDDDLNKVKAITTVLGNDALKIVVRLGYGASKDAKSKRLNAAMEHYGVNSFSVKQSREAVSRMEDDLRRLRAYDQFADAAPALAAVIIGKGLIDLKNIAEKLSTSVIADYIVAKDIYTDCQAIKDYCRYGQQAFKSLEAVVSSGADSLAKIAPNS